jgi:hypothetical protein
MLVVGDGGHDVDSIPNFVEPIAASHLTLLEQRIG